LDGLVGTVWDSKYFITSPNVDFVPEPPRGSSVVLRADCYYGEDDYLLWPQPWNADFCHLTAVRRKPHATKDNPDWIMWETFDRNSFTWTAGGECADGLGRLTEHVAQSVLESINRLINQTKDENAQNTIELSSNLREALHISRLRLEFTFAQLKGKPCTEDQARRGWVEVQRTWHNLYAMWTYLICHRERMRGRLPPASSASNVVGAFTYDGSVVQFLFLAGIPVWLIRPLTSFNDQNILAVVEMRKPQLCSTLSSSREPVLHRGHPGSSQKFLAIERATKQFCLQVDPFEVAAFELSTNAQPSGSSAVVTHQTTTQRTPGPSRVSHSKTTSKPGPYPKAKGKKGGKSREFLFKL
jgi:hypothetical protein